MKKSIFFITAILFLFACKNGNSSDAKDILVTNIDTTIKPSDDFFMYANGGWIKNTPIPGAESGWGIGNLVREENYDRIKKINEDAVAGKNAEGSISQKIADFYTSGMDTNAINKVGIAPLQLDIDKISAIKNTDDLLKICAELQTKGVECIFGNYVAQDDKNSEVMVFKLDQGGLGMPNRDYYFNTDAPTTKVRDAYKTYLLKTFLQLGMSDTTARNNAAMVFELEKTLAAASRKLADLRDPYKNYNKMAVKELAVLTPVIKWNEYVKNIGIIKLDTVIVGQPEFYTALNKALKTTPLDNWKNYLKFHLIANSAPYLDSVSFNNNFSYRKTLTGANEPRPRWKRVLDAEENAIGEALGQLFVKKYFDTTAKKRYEALVENIRTAYKERIEKLSWMSDSTKQKAYFKLAAITKKVGYPEKWKDFSALKIDNGPYILNVQRANQWWKKYQINKLGKPVDRTEWDMTPQTYNAYYNPGNNEIVLPAGMFSIPGMLDKDIDEALVYGYAGASTIGHEITHGFDDQGRQYDEKGNLKDWWNKADAAQFGFKAKNIIEQFNAMMPVDTLHINGSATQGENIADLGGMNVAYNGLQKALAGKNKDEKIDGFSADQRFFLSYAQVWRANIRDEETMRRLKEDVHSPGSARVNAIVYNIPAFYTAFNIQSTDKRYIAPENRADIW